MYLPHCYGVYLLVFTEYHSSCVGILDRIIATGRSLLVYMDSLKAQRRMIRIALFCVSYESDKEKDLFLSSIEQAKKRAMEVASVDVFVACNTKNNNPGYLGAVRLLMKNADLGVYDYVIISNVDLMIEEDFFIKLANYQCQEDIGWIAPQIWSEKEKRDKNPRQTVRYSLRKLKLLRLGYKYPWLDTLYTKTLYKRKKMNRNQPGFVYSGHGSFIVLTRSFLARCGKVNYPVFLFCEEIYLAEQCLQAGLKVVYAPEMKVTDLEHVSTGKMEHHTYCQHNLEAIEYIIKTFY